MNVRFSGTVSIGSFRNPVTKCRDRLGQDALNQIHLLIKHPDFKHYMGKDTTVRITRPNENSYRFNMHHGKVGPFIDVSGRLGELADATSPNLWLSRINRAFRKQSVPAPFSVEYLHFKHSWIRALRKLIPKTLAILGYVPSKPAF